MNKLLERAVMIKYAIELWGIGTTWQACIGDIEAHIAVGKVDSGCG